MTPRITDVARRSLLSLLDTLDAARAESWLTRFGDDVAPTDDESQALLDAGGLYLTTDAAGLLAVARGVEGISLARGSAVRWCPLGADRRPLKESAS